ncbi:phosphoenolpyruvate synthase [Neobacillus niacini]|uniref:phosphoenolpyruvate synthase n=1 Tax=Neobacillus niacini TaxID=86668 RepID=UPI0028579EB9|nr:phosphoenolpyruvate synthase [Neobacillus niacini]MDR6999620.1 pyruvate,water dikinase [Neobacillus niacini]
MTKAGFLVPQGFCVTTMAFQTFVQNSQEMNRFFDQLDHIQPDNLKEIRLLGQQIRNHLEHLSIPKEIEITIVEAWNDTGKDKAYAVRSSATAEDLPNASFAGQQETYLNVCGQKQLLDSVRKCWASLFTDRAISYRAKNGFDHRQVFLSVVVQEMVFPDVSGILFTADPISGNRKIASIDASFGLGEALVSGLVSADLYQVQGGQIIRKKISEKKIAIYSIPEGGTVTKELPPEEQKAQALSDDRIVELVKLGRKIESHYGVEQDIEWCFANGKFYIVQSRPITSLYPVPIFSDNQLHVLVSVGHIQMMTEAIKPLGISIFETIIPIACQAGGRIFADMIPVFSIKPLRKRIPLVLDHMDEQIGAGLKEVMERYGKEIPFKKRVPIWKIASFAWQVIMTIIRNLLFADPVQGRKIATDFLEKSVQIGKEKILNTSKENRIEAVRQDLRKLLPNAVFKIVPYWVSSVIASTMIKRVLDKWLKNNELIHRLERSMAGNVTSELGLMIGDLADLVRRHPQLAAHLQSRTDENFYEGLDEVPGGRSFHQELDRFMKKFGMRCPGEIDITRPRWREVPTTLIPPIMSHLRTVEAGEHREKFNQGAKEAEEAAMEIIEQVRKHKGKLKSKILSRFIKVYRGLGGLREHHKYLLVQYLDIYKRAILLEASELVKNGVLSEESDAFYLSINELHELTTNEFKGNVGELIEERKNQYNLNQKRTPPRVMTSDGEIISGKRREVDVPEGALIGTPVSSGIMEGYARVVLRPEDATLNAGEIMIAPFTDPGWTPLFHSAKALVMEVGGMMTHGAVVAREYGIPAVVGIDRATEIIKNGAYIKVDGTQGYVQILREPGNQNYD